jgi:hypothetical protein
MSFTVQEARAAFYIALLALPPHVGGPDYNPIRRFHRFCERSVQAVDGFRRIEHARKEIP